jgi:drug/metabolite transporter (DMT)-like permease
MLGAVGCFAFLDAIGKLLGAGYHAVQIVFFKSLFQLLPIAVVLARAGSLAPLATTMPWVQAARAILVLCAMALWFFGLVGVPLVDAYAIHMSAPIMIVLLARLALGEPMAGRANLALGLGGGGAAVILYEQGANPAAGALGASLLIVLATIAFAATMVVMRRMTPREAGWPSLAYGSLLAVSVTGAFLPWVWVEPDARAWALFAGLGLFGAAGGLLAGQAYARAPAAVVGPLEYTGMVWALALGYILFSERPDPLTLVGAALILAGGRLVARGQ